VRKIDAKLQKNGIQLTVTIAFPMKYLTDKIQDKFTKRSKP